MAIYQMINNNASEFPEGAYCDLYWSRHGGSTLNPVCMHVTAVGYCVQDIERNGYDDSDFYMKYWDPVAKIVCKVQYATTRGWTYPCMASAVDAPEEIMELARAYEREEERKSAIRSRWYQRKKDMELARKCRVSRFQLRDLKQAVGSEYIERVVALLTTQKFRSEFRQSLCIRVRAWLAVPRHLRQYKTPLSYKQLQWV